MLTQIRARNFRLIGDTPWSIQLAPLTVFVGPNGSGKSSMLYVPVLFAQTFRQREQSGLRWTEGEALSFPSREYMWHARKMENPLTLGVGMGGAPASEIARSLSYLYEAKLPLIKKQVTLREANYLYETKFVAANQYDVTQSLGINGSDVLRVELNRNPRDPYRWTTAATLDHKSLKFEFRGNSVPLLASDLFNPGFYLARGGRDLHAAEMSVLTSVLKFCSDASRQIIGWFERYLTFLGPVRGEPLMERDLKMTSLVSHVLEPSGQDTILWFHTFGGKPKSQRKLMLKWAESFGFPNPASASEAGKGTLFFDARDRKTRLDIWAASDGSKQVLPVIRRLLGSDSPMTHLIDEASLTLHAEWQVLLAAMVVEAARDLGQQVLLATHSSLLVQALSNLLRKGEIAPENVRVYSFDGKTNPSELDVSRKGIRPYPEAVARVEAELLREWAENEPREEESNARKTERGSRPKRVRS